MLPLYPPIKPYKKHTIAVEKPHKIYVEEVGDPEGIPVICCHPGPGGGSDGSMRRLFDPVFYRIIIFDQRGAGLSRPMHTLQNNTTAHLVQDMEVIRDTLKIDRWLVAGGGWGSALGLVYGQHYPARVLGFLLWGICLLRKRDLDWMYIDGINRFFPECWLPFARLMNGFPASQVFNVYHRYLTGDDDLMRLSAAKAWCTWEAQCATLHLNPEMIHQSRDPHNALNYSVIASHYFSNAAFLRENQILDNMVPLKSKPAKLVHGRYDMLSPLENAYLLKEAWGESAQLQVVREAGHSMTEIGIIDALVRSSKTILGEFGIDDREC
jgi:proline iminopeptidase